MATKTRLSPEDQARVDQFISQGVNSVERKPFRVWLLLGSIFVVLTVLSLLSFILARVFGVL